VEDRDGGGASFRVVLPFDPPDPRMAMLGPMVPGLEPS
jgi:hypothetical protein